MRNRTFPVLIGTFFVLLSVAAFGQTCVPSSTQSCSSNIGLALPFVNSPNWNVPIVNNFTLLDSILSGNANLTKLNFTNGTISGAVTFSGATTFNLLDNVVYIDGVKYACSDVGINAANTFLTGAGQVGGTIDARGCVVNGIAWNNSVTVGTAGQAATKVVRLLIDPATVVTMNVTSGASTDALDLGDGSLLDCSTGGVSNNGGFARGAFIIGASTNVRSIVGPIIRTGGATGQAIMAINGCNFIGSSGETIANAIVDLQGMGSNSYLLNTNIWNCFNTICLLLEPGSGSGGIISDINLNNVQANGGNVAGARPCVFKGNTPSHAISDISMNGGSCQHAGSGQYDVEVNGNNGGVGGAGACLGVDFFGVHVETSTGSLGWLIKDCQDVGLFGVRASGAGTSSGYINIQESAASVTQGITVRGSSSTATATNWVVNTAAGGSTIPISTVPGDYYFKITSTGLSMAELAAIPTPATSNVDIWTSTTLNSLTGPVLSISGGGFFPFGTQATTLIERSSAGPNNYVSSGVDICYGDSTAHAIKCNNNAAGFGQIPQTPTLAISMTAPTISAHFNTSGDSISNNNGTAAFTVTVGTGTAGSTGAVGLPTAAHGWSCVAQNQNRAAFIQQTANTTASATFTNYGTTIGTPVNWTNADVLAISCNAF